MSKYAVYYKNNLYYYKVVGIDKNRNSFVGTAIYIKGTNSSITKADNWSYANIDGATVISKTEYDNVVAQIIDLLNE